MNQAILRIFEKKNFFSKIFRDFFFSKRFFEFLQRSQIQGHRYGWNREIETNVLGQKKFFGKISTHMPQPAQAKPLFSAQPAQAAQKKSQIYPRVGYRLQLSFNKKSCALKKMVHFPAQPAQAKPHFSAQPAQAAFCP